MKHKPIFLDCTLRDGEQAPGVFFTPDEKLRIADLLDAAGIHMLDAGMPSVSEEERRTLRALCSRGYRATIAGTVRAVRQDVDQAVDCGLREVFLFMPVSPQHLHHKFGATLQKVRPRLEETVAYAVEQGLRVHFVAEDTVRGNPKELASLFDALAALPVASVMICDTVGVMWPDAIARFIGAVRDLMLEDVPFGVHCHNDYGLATANTLAAFGAGCRIVSGTLNGLGERAGNAALEEVICALENLFHARPGIEKRALLKACREVAVASGVFVSPTKPVTGLNVFRHESGVHVDGMLKDRSTYESLDPAPLGRRHEFVLGKHSGTGLIQARLAERGLELPPEALRRILEAVKRAKTATDKAAYADMAERLQAFWRRYLDFDEAAFWSLVAEEVGEEEAVRVA